MQDEKEEKKHSFFPDVYLSRFSSTIKLTVTAIYRDMSRDLIAINRETQPKEIQ
ncbi:hypothetical protein [Serratia sp. UGAL515B_01]|uniref:hypothetical protein n=1 Tax=Serratia sp. UGAL515B_01 TaxID=2986763 RepID=UPI002954EF7E|nr:hypothetical protein [Serratia sp. UGAL515B_01]WON77310.1 hypothetical protein OK023_00910 [Serratia sp. UGAL515B_01]